MPHSFQPSFFSKNRIRFFNPGFLRFSGFRSGSLGSEGRRYPWTNSPIFVWRRKSSPNSKRDAKVHWLRSWTRGFALCWARVDAQLVVQAVRLPLKWVQTQRVHQEASSKHTHTQFSGKKIQRLRALVGFNNALDELGRIGFER